MFRYMDMFWTRENLLALHRDAINNARRLRAIGAPWARDNAQMSLTIAAECRRALTH